MAETDLIWHAPQPGPMHWDWRCLRCSEPVSRHASLWRRVKRRLLNPPEKDVNMSDDRYPVETFTADEWGYEVDDGTMPENVEMLRTAVVGHRIVSIEEDAPYPKGERDWGRATGLALTLDNGDRVFLRDTDDCCAYTDLEGVIKHLDQIDHIITGVGTTDGYTTWHIYADLGDVLELKVGWSAGNPFYYGYGFDIDVIAAPTRPAIPTEEAGQ